ncbi:MAG: hypothetical protein IJT85_03805 [Ruminococcus sp.]|nr:hypothetical protein [Ruminococcus sp.]
MRYLIADLVTEFTALYDNTKLLAEPFIYNEDRETDIKLNISYDYVNGTAAKPNCLSTKPQLENFAFSNVFNRAAIKYGVMLVHSSALICDGGAYLFSADSGVGKSTHTKLWLKAFGDKVHIMNDDKPVVKLYDDHAVAFGTPFDGGSGIALNESYPLKAIIFVERGEENSVRIPENKEIIQKLYFQTARMVNRETAEKMLINMERLLHLTKFYVLTCNMDISAAHTAYKYIIEKNPNKFEVS